MVSKSSLVTSLLLAFTALADPSRLGEHIPRRRTSHRSQLTSRNLIETSENWGGAELRDATGLFTSVNGTFTLPVVYGYANTGVSFGVGIDDDNCSVLLRAGVSASVGSDSKTVSYSAWYDLVPESDGLVTFPDIHINPGDVITASVNISSNKKSASVNIRDQTTGVSVGQEIKVIRSGLFCGKTAEWIVENYPRSSSNGNLSPLANFGTVVFTGADAHGAGRTYPASGGSNATGPTSTNFAMDQNGQDVTSTSTYGDVVIIQYVGP